MFVLGVIEVEQSHRIISRQSRHLTDWKRCHIDLKEPTEEVKRVTGEV